MSVSHTSTPTPQRKSDMEEIKDTARETAEDVRDAAQDQIAKLEGAIRRNPMAAAGVAAAAGFVLAALIRR